ncbi:MAG: hypothetical protein WBY94_28570 [Polyangiaceae bacterium]
MAAKGVAHEPIRRSIRVVPERYGHRPKPLDHLNEFVRAHTKSGVMGSEGLGALEEHLPPFGDSHARDLVLSPIPRYRKSENRAEEPCRGFVVP